MVERGHSFTPYGAVATVSVDVDLREMIRMKPAVPWSVKGVEPEAREAAKRAARGSGMTLGAWLTRKIQESDDPTVTSPADRPPAAPHGADPQTDGNQSSMAQGRTPSYVPPQQGDYGYTPQAAQRAELGAVAPSIDALRRHLQDSESRTERTFSQISDALQAVLRKLDQAGAQRQDYGRDESSDSLRAINTALNDVSHRLANVERRNDGGSVAHVERSLSELNRALDSNEARAMRRSDQLENALDNLRDRVDTREGRRMEAVRGLERAVTEVAQRQDKTAQNQADALRRTDQSVSELKRASESQTKALHAELETMREKMAQVTGHLDTLRETVSKSITKADLAAIEKRVADAAKTSSEETQKVLRAEMIDRLDAAETRSADAITALAAEVGDIRETLSGAPDLSAFREELNEQLGEIVSRLEVLNGEVESRFEHFAEEAQNEIESLRREMAERTSVAAPTPAVTARETTAPTPEEKVAASTVAKPLRAPEPTARPTEAPARPARPVRKERPDRPARATAKAEARPTRAWVWMITLLLFAIGITALALRFLPGNSDVVGPINGYGETPLPEPDTAPPGNDTDELDFSGLTQSPNLTLDTTPDRPNQPRAAQDTERTGLARGGSNPATTSTTERPAPTNSPAATNEPVIGPPITVEPAPPQPAEMYAEAQNLLEAGTASGDLAAARRLRTAANAGLVIAQYRLATLYETGRGVPQDMALARDWYLRAAEGGNLRAMHNLANLYAESLVDGNRNYTEATRWFAEAASFGILDSQYNLGVIFERGIGVRADTSQAYLWYSIAAAGGDTDAVARRDDIATQLDADVRSQIDQAVADWQPRAADPEANGRLSISRPLGASANDVALAQDLLNRLGFTAGPSDGIMGPRTAEAIRIFEQRAGLAVTGRVSDALLSRLQSAVSGN